MDGMEDELPPSFVSKIDNNKSYNVEIERVSSSLAQMNAEDSILILGCEWKEDLTKKKNECS